MSGSRVNMSGSRVNKSGSRVKMLGSRVFFSCSGGCFFGFGLGVGDLPVYCARDGRGGTVTAFWWGFSWGGRERHPRTARPLLPLVGRLVGGSRGRAQRVLV